MIPFKFVTEHPNVWFFDLDGTILEYNLIFSEGIDRLLPGVKSLWSSFSKDDMIILVTARPSYLKEKTIEFLNENNIRFNHIIFDLPRGERILVNDTKPNGTKTALAWCVNRNNGFL